MCYVEGKYGDRAISVMDDWIKHFGFLQPKGKKDYKVKEIKVNKRKKDKNETDKS